MKYFLFSSNLVLPNHLEVILEPLDDLVYFSFIYSKHFNQEKRFKTLLIYN